MRRTRKAKIVATLGPASTGPEAIRALFEAGADVFRFNFSHGTHEDHRTRLDRVPRAEGNGTATTGRSACFMRRLDEFARFSAEPAALTRLYLTPEHTAAERVAAWMNEAGASADPDAAGDVVGRYETRVIAAGAPFRVAETTNLLKIMTA